MPVEDLPSLLHKMWQDYTRMNPQAQRIHQLFEERGETVQNDHIALRTFNHPKVTIDVLAQPFIDSGYVYQQDYQFPAKKLYAKHYQHPDEQYPKIFISELLIANMLLFQ